MYPILYDFITYRLEGFGGYVYNPYLVRQVALNHAETALLNLMNGNNSVEEIRGMIDNSPQKNLFLDIGIDQSLLCLTTKLDRIYALKWNRLKTEYGINAFASLVPFNMSRCHDTSHLYAPLSVIWDITTRCNLRCGHCLSASGFAANNELRFEEIVEIIDQLAAMRVFTITFCGGEPLLRKEILPILKYATSKKFGIKISSNGILVDDALLENIEDFNVFSFQLSLDGTEATHDRFRGKKGAFRETVRALERLSSLGYNVTVAPVITRQTIDDIDSVLDTAIAHGAAAFRPSVFLPVGRGQENFNALFVDGQAIKECFVRLERKKQELRETIRIETDRLYPGLCGDEAPEFSPDGSDAQVGCSAGTTQVVITADGKVVPCSFLYDFEAGDLRRDSFENIWRSSSTLTMFRTLTKSRLKGKCRTCSYIPNKCNGGCRAAAYLINGDIFSEDPICWV